MLSWVTDYFSTETPDSSYKRTLHGLQQTRSHRNHYFHRYDEICQVASNRQDPFRWWVSLRGQTKLKWYSNDQDDTRLLEKRICRLIKNGPAETSKAFWLSFYFTAYFIDLFISFIDWWSDCSVMLLVFMPTENGRNNPIDVFVKQ